MTAFAPDSYVVNMKMMIYAMATLHAVTSAQAEKKPVMPKALLGEWCSIANDSDTYRRLSDGSHFCQEGALLTIEPDGFDTQEEYGCALVASRGGVYLFECSSAEGSTEGNVTTVWTERHRMSIDAD